MEDSLDDDSCDSVQASTATIDKTMPEPPAPTTGRRRRRTNRARRTTAKPRGRGRKSTASGTTAGGSTRGRGRQAETAAEMPLEAITTESESSIDLQAEVYVSKIMPDASTIMYTDRNSGRPANGPCTSYSVYECCEDEPPVMSPQRRRMCRAQAGRWAALLPVGTVVRRPSVKLVQLVAQAIHESPHRVLRVTHVYAALQNRYPYYKLLDKKGISSWKSSVRHALFQKWFIKLRPTSVIYETVRPRSYFWGLNYYLSYIPSAFSTPDHGGAGQRDDDDDASVLFAHLHLGNEPPNKRAAPTPSAFRLELEKSIFSPPETKTPPGRKRRRTAARDCSDCTPSVPQPPVDELAGPSSTSSLPHMDLWKMDYMKVDSWPEAHQASASATTSATTSVVSTMMSPQSTAATFVEAAVDSFQRSWQPLSGEQFLQLRQDEQQQVTLMMQQAMNMQQPPQQTLQEALQASPELQQAWGEFVTAPQGGEIMDLLRSAEGGCPAELFDDKFSPVGSPQGENSNGGATYDANGPFSPRSVLCSPPHVTQTSSPPGLTTMPSADTQPPVADGLQSPKPEKDAATIEPMAPEQARRFGSLVTGFGLPPVDDSGDSAVFLNLPWPMWHRLTQRNIVRKNVERGRRIVFIGLAPLPTPKPEESPKRQADGDDKDDCDDGDLLPLEQPDSCSAPPPTDPDRSPPTEQGEDCKLESASTPQLV
ncbi:hypothetical protein MTO96_024411 [Rhipicephalus appendiculatus]